MKTLDDEEKGIVEAYEAGKLKRVLGAKREIARHKRYAATPFTKDARINIRISSRDLRELQKLALKEGLPCQFRQPGMSDAQFAADKAAVEQDLKALKGLLEQGMSGRGHTGNK